MYDTTTELGCFCFHSRNCLTFIVSANEQPACKSGINIFFFGDKIAAVSAIKFTPQNIIKSLSEFKACNERLSESPTTSAKSCISGI